MHVQVCASTTETVREERNWEGRGGYKERHEKREAGSNDITSTV